MKKIFEKIFFIPHFFYKGVRKYIVSDEKTVSFVGSGEGLLQIF